MFMDHIDQIVACGKHVSPGSQIRLQPLCGMGVTWKNNMVFVPAIGCGGSVTSLYPEIGSLLRGVVSRTNVGA